MVMLSVLNNPVLTLQLGILAGINGQNSEGMCQGGKPGTGKLYTDVCLCCSAHTSGCVVDGLGATVAIIIIITDTVELSPPSMEKRTAHTRSDEIPLAPMPHNAYPTTGSSSVRFCRKPGVSFPSCC